ncbi:MAG: hypothetical protein ACP5P4_15135 [Steroidobacteraceae bacterium]
MLLDLTITKLSPPHRAQARAGGHLRVPRIESEELLAKFADVLRVALEDGLFDGSGCLNIVVQRAADKS